MQTLVLDLKKNPEVKDLVVDMEPGDRICLYGTIKALDDQSLTVTVEEVEEDKTEKDETPGGNEGSAGEDAGDDVSKPPVQAGSSPDAARDMMGGEQAAM